MYVAFHFLEFPNHDLFLLVLILQFLFNLNILLKSHFINLLLLKSFSLLLSFLFSEMGTGDKTMIFYWDVINAYSKRKLKIIKINIQ